MRQLEQMEEYEERFSLVSERIEQLGQDAEMVEPFASYFREVAAFLCLVKKSYTCIVENTYETFSLEQRQQMHDALYDRLRPEVYDESYLNPAYAQSILGRIGWYAEYVVCRPFVGDTKCIRRPPGFTLYLERIICRNARIFRGRDTGAGRRAGCLFGRLKAVDCRKCERCNLLVLP